MSKNETTINDVLKIQKRLRGVGITLIVIGGVGILLLLLSLVNYGIKQSKNYSCITEGVVLYYFISIIILSLMLSGGIYMYKTSRVIMRGVKNKIEKEVNNDQKK